MVKKIVIGVTVLGVVLLACFKLFSSFSKEDNKINDIKNNLQSYHMEATMEINDNDENKNYFIVVDYAKKDEEQLFRISLLDTDINQEQIFLKNSDGVFVLTPMLNQVYKFKGNYPLNSQKPYLYHSMLEGLDGEHELKSMSDGYLLSYKPNYEHQKKWVKQDVKLSNDFKPVWVNIYNENSALVVSIIYSKVDFNLTYENDFFDVNTNMEKAKETLTNNTFSSLEDLPLIPTSMIESATLKEQTEVKTNNNDTLFILTYEGDKNYRVIQKLLQPSEELTTYTPTGEFIDTIYGISYYNNNYLTYITGNVCCEIYSLDLQVSDMVNIATSLEVSINK